MKVTVQRKNTKDDKVTYTSTDVYKVFELMQSVSLGVEVLQLRQACVSPEMEHLYSRYDRIPQVTWASKRRKMANGDVIFGEYSGIVALKIEGITFENEMQQVKRETMLLPQTLATFEEANGRGVVILALASLPDGSLPRTQSEAEMFHIKAYRTAVLCYAPTLGRAITIEQPLLEATQLLGYDLDMLVNKNAIPFIIEQPTPQEVQQLSDGRQPQNALTTEKGRSVPVVSMHQAYNVCRDRALGLCHRNKWLEKPMAAVAVIARECAEAGIPEEEATQHTLWHYYKSDDQDIRSTIRTVYQDYEDLPEFNPAMPKKQVASLRLREFMNRRYELRYNEVMQMMEYRVRHSLDFQFRELGKFDKNTIKYEAAREGIEAFESEVSGFIESNYTPRYNPIDDFLGNLGKWDGKPRIEALAQLVPTDNANWPQLFRRWFLSMVAHWMGVDKEHGNNTAPILIGKQAYRKSTFCRILLPPELRQFFTDSLDLRTKQEAERCLTRYLLINIDEFDQLSEQQFAFIKHLFQKPNVSMRRMYSETIAQQRRYTSFIGTSNHEEILRDPTGNRRYLCVRVTSPIHVETPIDYRQLYAEAVTLVREGKERYWFGDEEEALLKDSNKAFEAQHPLEHIFLDLFAVVPENDAGGSWMRLTDILDAVSRHRLFNRKTMNNLRTLGHVLIRMNLLRKHANDGTYYWVKKKQ